MAPPTNRRCSKRPPSRRAPKFWSRSPRSSSRRARPRARPCNSGSPRASLTHQPETHMTERPASSVDPKLLEILVCPLTKGPLEYDREKQELISRSAKLAYPIRDGIPIMLPEEARRLD